MLEWVERRVSVGGSELVLRETGQGRTLLVLHDEMGPTASLKWQEDMARQHRLCMPVQPGFRGERIGWIRSVRDLSCLYGQVLRDLDAGPVDVIGFSFGGWIAAEMAVNNPRQFGKMALVAPFGIKPTEGFILDFFPMTSADYVAGSVHDANNSPEFDELYGPQSPEQIEAWEEARTECARLAWEPYMHDPSLEHLLAGVGSLPALLFWGDKDAILPESAMHLYKRAIPNSELKVFENCGHRPEIEQRDEFVKSLSRFLN